MVKGVLTGDQYLRIKCAPVSSGARARGLAPARADTLRHRSAARDFAAVARSARNSPAGHTSARKKSSLVITLAGSLTAFGSRGFRLLARSRWPRLWPFRFSWPAADSR